MLIDELKEIIKKEKDVIPFLKRLSLEAKNKKALTEQIKQLASIVFERKEIREKSEWGGFSYSYKATHTDAQQEIMNAICFVYYNKTDARRRFGNSTFLVSDIVTKRILPWFVPKWYSDLLNEVHIWYLDYPLIIKLYEGGYLDPSKELITNRLPSAIFDSSWKNQKNTLLYKPEVLELNEITLATHIWYLFEEESTINYHNYELNFSNYQKINDLWIHTFSKLLEERKIDRIKLITATIYTATKGFNKVLSSWFFELLLKLNLTKVEVISFQDELFTALNSPHSKVVNTVLKYFKVVAADKKFKHPVFIENSPILLSSEVKLVVNSTLMILDKIAKTQDSLKEEVCLKASEALLNTDEKIQVRAAKIIAKYGDTSNEELKNEIEMYADNLFHTAKEVLHEYDIETIEEAPEEGELQELGFIENAKVNVLSDATKLPVYTTFDDIFFFVNQVLDNNEPYHLDLLLVYLPKLNLLIDQHNVSRLTPLLKRALNLAVSYEWSHRYGHLETMASYLISDFGKILLRKYPAELADFWTYKDKKLKDADNAKRYRTSFVNQTIQDHVYNIHRFLLMQTKEYIENNQAFEFLSTPTHEPCWIDPEAFVERLLVFQNKIVQYDFYDFQIALARIPIVKLTDTLVQKIESIQSKEIRAVLQYQFGKNTLQESAILRPKVWMQSVLTRKVPEEITYFESKTFYSLQRETAKYQWTCEAVERTYKSYNYQKAKYEEEKITEKKLFFTDYDKNLFKEVSVLGKVKNIFFSKKKIFGDESIYKLLYFIEDEYVTNIRPKDDVKFLYLAPNNPSPFLAQLIFHNLKRSKFWSEDAKKNMINVLKGLYEIWYRKDYGEVTYLFLAVGFLCSDKVAREIAAEIWIKATSESTMNHELLGKTIGKLQHGEYAPMKRLTDILSLNMFNVSHTHNAALLALTDAMISEMNAEPLRGTKKLLEIFTELNYKFSKFVISEDTIQKLNVWKTTKSLKTIVEKLV